VQFGVVSSSTLLVESVAVWSSHVAGLAAVTITGASSSLVTLRFKDSFMHSPVVVGAASSSSVSEAGCASGRWACSGRQAPSPSAQGRQGVPAAAASAQWGWPIHGSAGTIDALGFSGGTDVSSPDVRLFSAGRPTSISGFLVETTSVPHDARDCRALVITDVRSGARAGIAMDVGHVPDTLPIAFERLDLLVVESNHDEAMLARGPYPWSLKERIRGGLGHLSNGAAAAFVSACAHRGLRGVLLTHLSETNNLPSLAIERTREALRRAGWTRDALLAASQQLPLPPMTSEAR
jgi:hypothetical protein